jgi:hypothetical protein
MKQLIFGIYRILFEPFFIGALLASLSILLFYIKRRNIWFIAASFAAVFMLAWRIVCYSIMISSRYSAILIFPALLLVAWLCTKMGVYFRRFFPSQWGGKWKSPFCHLLEAASVIGMMFGCIGQILHFNPYANWFTDVISVYQQHATPNDIIYAQEPRRVAFYTQRKMQNLQILTFENNEPVEFLSQQLQQNKNIPGKHYFFFSKKKAHLEPTAEALKLSPQDGTWKILARSFVSRRKNKEFILALFKPACPNITEWNEKIPALPENDLYKSIGDFEKQLPHQQQKSREKYFQKLGITKYADLSDRPLPASWWIGLNVYYKNNPPDIRLRTINPLAGKSSLYIDAVNKTASVNAHYLFKNCKVEFYVRAEGNEPTLLDLICYSKNLKLKKFQPQTRLKFRLFPGKTYRIQKVVDLKEFPDGFKNICPIIQVNGCATIDQFSIIPDKSNRN